jgi:integrase
MPRGPRGKRVLDPETGKYVVVGRAPNGEPDPYFDRTRGVWVAPWRKPDGKVGRPTGKTRAAAVASRDRHIAKVEEEARYGPLADGFTSATTVAELCRWWLDNVARHRVRASSLATYEKQLRVVGDRLGEVPVRELRTERVATFISDLVDAGSASRAKHVRTVLGQVLNEAVNLGLAESNVAKKVRPPRVPKVKRPTLSPAEVSELIGACSPRIAAAAALCYVQGWRVSEALGLAWQDLDMEAGSVRVRRASTYADGQGMVLGPPKTERTVARQLLGPTVVQLLRARHELYLEDRAKLGDDAWPVVEYEGEPIGLVFTTAAGKPTLRQKVDAGIRQAAAKIGLDPTHLGTHTGRRSVVTNLYATGAFDLADVASYVGHADVTTTKGYVQHEGDRPEQVSRKAFELLDPSVAAVDGQY